MANGGGAIGVAAAAEARLALRGAAAGLRSAGGRGGFARIGYRRIVISSAAKATASQENGGFRVGEAAGVSFKSDEQWRAGEIAR